MSLGPLSFSHLVLPATPEKMEHTTDQNSAVVAMAQHQEGGLIKVFPSTFVPMMGCHPNMEVTEQNRTPQPLMT